MCLPRRAPGQKYVAADHSYRIFRAGIDPGRSLVDEIQRENARLEGELKAAKAAHDAQARSY